MEATLATRRPALAVGCAIVGGEVAYFRRSVAAVGPRQSAVFVHGVGVSGESLVPTAQRLAAARDVLVPDLPGFGRSSCGAPFLDTEALADAVAGLVDHLGVGPSTMVGSSYGCQVVVELALRRPDLVVAVTLVSPTVDPSAQRWDAQLWRWLRNFLRERHVQQGSTLAEWRRAGLGRVAATGRECLRYRLDRGLPLLRVPALLIRGADDAIVPQRWLDEASRLVPGAQTAVVPGAAHSVAFTHPAEVAGPVDELMRAVEA